MCSCYELWLRVDVLLHNFQNVDHVTHALLKVVCSNNGCQRYSTQAKAITTGRVNNSIGYCNLMNHLEKFIYQYKVVEEHLKCTERNG